MAGESRVLPSRPEHIQSVKMLVATLGSPSSSTCRTDWTRSWTVMFTPSSISIRSAIRDIRYTHILSAEIKVFKVWYKKVKRQNSYFRYIKLCRDTAVRSVSYQQTTACDQAFNESQLRSLLFRDTALCQMDIWSLKMRPQCGLKILGNEDAVMEGNIPEKQRLHVTACPSMARI